MEKPIPPNPDTMTDEEFDKWLERIYLGIRTNRKGTLSRWHTRGHKHPGRKRSRLARICCQGERKRHLARRLIY